MDLVLQSQEKMTSPPHKKTKEIPVDRGGHETYGRGGKNSPWNIVTNGEESGRELEKERVDL